MKSTCRQLQSLPLAETPTLLFITEPTISIRVHRKERQHQHPQRCALRLLLSFLCITTLELELELDKTNSRIRRLPDKQANPLNTNSQSSQWAFHSVDYAAAVVEKRSLRRWRRMRRRRLSRKINRSRSKWWCKRGR